MRLRHADRSSGVLIGDLLKDWRQDSKIVKPPPYIPLRRKRPRLDAGFRLCFAPRALLRLKYTCPMVGLEMTDGNAGLQTHHDQTKLLETTCLMCPTAEAYIGIPSCERVRSGSEIRQARAHPHALSGDRDSYGVERLLVLMASVTTQT